MTAIPAALANLTQPQLDEMLCRANPGVWAERRRGFHNAPFHFEWYRFGMRVSRGCLIAPRDHSKSETFTVNLPTWRAIYHPGWWTYIFAATADQAFALKARVDQAMLETAPDLYNGATVLSRHESIYANGSRLNAAGAGKAIRGAHPELIIGDDVLTDATAGTEHQRRKIDKWWFGTVGGMAHPGTTRRVPDHGRVNFPATQVILVGTPFHSQDLLMMMRRNPVYTYRRYAAEFDDTQLVDGSWAVEAVGEIR